MRAVKGNKEYMIDESQKKSYQDGRYDILDDTGAVIAYGRGKTVPYDDYMKAVAEIKRLKSRVSDLSAENEALKVENEERKAADQGKKTGTKKAGE